MKDLKITKTITIFILIVIISTGIIYASIIIIDKLKKETEPVNLNTTNIQINSNEEIVKTNMPQYNEEIPQLVKFKFSEFYIENFQEFYNLDTEYNEEQNYYSLEISDINQYNSIVQKLGLNTYRQVNVEEFKETKAILIFRENNEKLTLNNFRLKEDIPNILLDEVDEEYGKGITGALIIFDTRFENYNIEIESRN